MAEGWYYVKNGQQCGPFTFDQFRQMASSGLLAPNDMVLSESTQHWVSARAVASLFPQASHQAVSQGAPAGGHIEVNSAPVATNQQSIPAPEQPVPQIPELWNPNAAANWSILLTPAFGAYLNAANWRALAKPKRAMANLVWVWITVVFLVIYFGFLLVNYFIATHGVLQNLETLDNRVLHLIGPGLLFGWYFTQGRSQAKYIKESLGNNYVKKGWGLPLLIGVAAIGTYIAVVYLLAIAGYRLEPVELAAEIKPLILQEWQKKPELRDASIQKISLDHKGGKVYTGFVDAIIGGRWVRLSLEVVCDRSTISWDLKLPANN